MTVSELIEHLNQFPPDIVVALAQSVDGVIFYRKIQASDIEVEAMEPAFDWRTKTFSDDEFNPVGTTDDKLAQELEVLLIGG